MRKESGHGDAPGSSLLAAAASRLSRGASGRNLSPSAKYRVSTTSSSIAMVRLAIDTTVSSSSTSPIKPASPTMRRQPSEKAGSRSPSKFSDLNHPSAESGSQAAATSKLPSKIRASVTQMRSQLALLSLRSNNNLTADDETPAPRPARSRQASVIDTGPRYFKVSQLLTEMSTSSPERRVSVAKPQRRSTVGATHKLPQMPPQSESAESAMLSTFMELLRPLQKSMHVLGRRLDGGSEIDQNEDADADTEDDEDDLAFRQHERESSRVLRIVCSLDNLLFAITDQVQRQEDKLDLEVIASGPARELVQLLISGMQQMATTLAKRDVPFSSRDEQYLRAFLLELSDRWAKLDAILQQVYETTLHRVRADLSELQQIHEASREHTFALERELIETREFHSSQSAAAVGVASNMMLQLDGAGPETEETQPSPVKRYELSTPMAEEKEGELERLRRQCDEYARLLEMAKQEIQLSHAERQYQHARLVELSQSLLKDREVAALRSELQCEKKRVKLLEMETLSLRETQVDLNLKLQSLLRNQPNLSTVKPSSVPSQPPLALSPVEATTKDTAVADGHPTQQGCVMPQADPSNSSTDTSSSWLQRVVESGHRSKPEQEEEDGLVRLFLSNLMMTVEETQAAAAQAKLRKKANVPTQGRPPSEAPLNSSPTKKKAKFKAPSDPRHVAVAASEWASDAMVVASVRQLVWVFYEQYLMQEEARRLAVSSGTPPLHKEPASLATLVLHYFLSRYATEEEAMHSVRRFVTVLSRLRAEYGDVRLFCGYLEGSRTSEELQFMLWLLQAIDAVTLGVVYEDSQIPGARLGRSMCTLKAVYLTRMVFRLLHIKALKKPAHDKPKAVAKGSPTKINSSQQPVAQASGAASPKKSKKKRPASAAKQTGDASTREMSSESVATMDPPVKVSLIDCVQAKYEAAVAANSGYPLTLESVNALLLEFAETPTEDELRRQLSGFYQPTGDERKVAVDMFLLLMAEVFATQLQWRKTQLRALFIRLAEDEEVQRLLQARIEQEAVDAAEAQGKKKASQKPPHVVVKKKKNNSAKRGRRVCIDVGVDRYLCGLSRERLRKLLVMGGLVPDVAEEDVDAIYVAVLERAKATPCDIHFDQVYEALSALELLKNEAFAVDFSAWSRDDGNIQTECDDTHRSAVKDAWQLMSTQALTVTENDPNVYARRIIRRLKRHAEAALQSPTSLDKALERMRACLAFAWRAASRRGLHSTPDQLGAWLAESFHLTRAIAIMTDTSNHFTSTTDHVAIAIDPLSAFYDPRAVVLGTLASSSDAIELRGVLERYALCFAHLFDSFTTCRFTANGPSGLTKDQWIAMARELGFIHDKVFPVTLCDDVFVQVVGLSTQRRGGSIAHDLEADKPRFIELLVRTAVDRHRIIHNKKQHTGGKQPPPSVASVFEHFCRELIVPRAFHHRGRLLEEDFHRKLRCPLIAKVLLDHRSFLRSVFYFYIKPGDRDGLVQGTTGSDCGVPVPPDSYVYHIKSSRNSMTLQQFLLFLGGFQLLESTMPLPSAFTLDERGAAYLFRAVMAIECEDVSRMELDEFTAAVAAIAVLRNCHPFLLSHVKIDDFVTSLRRHRHAHVVRGESAMALR